MNPIQTFNPAIAPSGIIQTNGINKGEQLLLFNSSLSCLQLTFPDKTNDILPPSWCRDWIKSSPMGNITYKTLFTVPLSGQPVSILYGTLYEPGEHVASVNQSLQYVYAVGNTVNTMGGGQTLINTGNAPSSANVIEIGNTTSGDTFDLDNQGNVVIGNPTNLGSLFLYGIATIAQALQIRAGSSNELHIIAYNGTDIVFQSPVNTEIARIVNNGTFRVGTVRPSGSNLNIGVDTGEQVNFQVNGVNIASFLANAFNFNQQLKFTVGSANGSLTAMCLIPLFGLTTTQTTYNHSLGVVPDFIVLQTHGVSSTAQTAKVDFNSLTSTTFKAVGSTTMNAVGIAIKF